MKQLLIATAALSLLGGAAFAQTTPNNPTGNPISDSTAPAGTTMGGQAATGDMPQAADGSPAAPSTGANPAPSSAMSPGMSTDSTSTGAMASPPPASPTTTADATPATYPVCTSKHQDRCVNRAQATRTAKLATRHQKTDNVQPAG